MKEKIATYLIRLAKWLNPSLFSMVSEKGRETKKLGISFAVSPAEISHYRQHKGCSYVKAQHELISDTKKRVRQSIYAGLLKGEHIEYDVHKQGGDIIVSGCIYINVKTDAKS
jgi:hypothetical protein